MIDFQECEHNNNQDSSSNIETSSSSCRQSSSSSSCRQSSSAKSNGSYHSRLNCKIEESNQAKIEEKDGDKMEIEIQEQFNLQAKVWDQWRILNEEKFKALQLRKENDGKERNKIDGVDYSDLYYDEDEREIMNEEDIRQMHYGVIKINSNLLQIQDGDSEDKYNGDNQEESKVISCNDMLLQHFVMKKQIAKMKKNSSKKFIKKPLAVQPIFFKEIASHNKFMIFGYSQIEQFYRDFDDQHDSNLILQCKYVVDVNRIVDNFANNLIEIYYNVKGKSGLTDFRFLIDHYSKIPDQRYHELSELLKQYQHLVSISVSHMSKINRMIRFQMLTEEEIAQAFAQSEIYFTNYVKNKYRTNPSTNPCYSDYLMYTTVRSNYNTLDLDVYSNIFTKQMFDIFGFDSSALDILSAINTPFQMPNGNTRLKDLTNLIRIYVSQQSFYNIPITFFTQDGIQVTTTIDCEIINWPHKPEWMIPLDTFMILLKFNLTQRELSQFYVYRAPPKSIENIKIESQVENKKGKSSTSSQNLTEKSQQDIDGNSQTKITTNSQTSLNLDQQYKTDKFEYIMQTELFLEKFYPDFNNESSNQQIPSQSNLQNKNQNNKKGAKTKKK